MKPEGFFHLHALTAAIIPSKIGITLFRRNTLLSWPFTLDIDKKTNGIHQVVAPSSFHIETGEERIHKAMATSSGIEINKS